MNPTPQRQNAERKRPHLKSVLKANVRHLWVDWPMWLRQALKFLIVGVSNTLLDASLYFLLTRWLGLSTRRTLAKAISYSAGVLNSFYWNRTWTFKTQASLGALLTFGWVNLIGLGLNAGVMALCLDVFQIHEGLALASATGVAFIWNFAASKSLVFRR